MGRHETPRNEKERSAREHDAGRGFVRIEDFFIFIKNEIRTYSFEETMSAFKLFDKEDENVIDLSCLRNIVGLLGDEMSMSEVDDIMSRADIDGDGSVNYEVFAKNIFK